MLDISFPFHPSPPSLTWFSLTWNLHRGGRQSFCQCAIESCYSKVLDSTFVKAHPSRKCIPPALKKHQIGPCERKTFTHKCNHHTEHIHGRPRLNMSTIHYRECIKLILIAYRICIGFPFISLKALS